MITSKRAARIVGGVSRDISGHLGDPSCFDLRVDRGLKSGTLDVIALDEADILALVKTGAEALTILARERAAGL